MDVSSYHEMKRTWRPVRPSDQPSGPRQKPEWSKLAGAGRAKPMPAEPSRFCGQGITAPLEAAQHGPADGVHVGPPLAAFIRLDVRSAADRELAESRQVNRFRVETANLAARSDDELHGQLPLRVRRRMFRRGRSTSKPSSTDWTPASCVAICCRRGGSSRKLCGETPRVTC